MKSAHIQFRGEVAAKKTKLITSSFATGLLCSAFDENVNIVNATMIAADRGIEITESSTSESGDFSTILSATITTDTGELTASGTMFGHEFLRLVRLGNFQLDAYLDGLLVIYRHRDVPGLIGLIGTTFGKHNVNIAHMALGRTRNEPGGEAIGVLNIDTEPSAEALAEIRAHENVTSVEVVKLPLAGEPLPWAVSGN